MSAAPISHDRQAMERLYGAFIDQVNSAAVTMQDRTYGLGVDRGIAMAKAEADADKAAMLAALREAVLALAHASQANPGLYARAYETVDRTIKDMTEKEPKA